MFLEPRSEKEEKLPELLSKIIQNRLINTLRNAVQSGESINKIISKLPRIYIPECVKLELAMKLLVYKAFCSKCRKTISLPDYSKKIYCPYCHQELTILEPRKVDEINRLLEQIVKFIESIYKNVFEQTDLFTTELFSRKTLKPHKVKRILFYTFNQSIVERFVLIGKPNVSEILDLAIELRKIHERIIKDFKYLPKSMFDYLIIASSLHIALKKGEEVVCLISVGKDLAKYVELCKRYAKKLGIQINLYHVNILDIIKIPK